jgi:hypothetical protein
MPRVLVGLGLAACLAARSASAESIFGLNLLGERVESVDARSAAVGGFTQVVDDSLGLLQYNPAMLAWSKRVTFGAAGYVTRDANQSSDLERVVVGTKFTTFVFAFPIYRPHLTASVGYRARYDPDGDFRIPNETSTGDVYSDLFERRGGTWSVPLSLAADLGRYAKLGGFFSLERGTIENRWVVDFEGSNSADALSDRNYELSGNGFGVGGVLRPLANVTLGAAYEGSIEYDTEVKETYTNSSIDTAYSETTVQPARWTGSVTWRVMRGFQVYAGASTCDFREFEGLAFPPSRLAREQTMAFGLEYRIQRWRLPVRASVRHDQLPYTLPDGEEIARLSFALGSGLLFRGGRGKIDTALEFAQVGSVDTNTYEDRQVRFYLSINGSEDWKRDREDRY